MKRCLFLTDANLPCDGPEPQFWREEWGGIGSIGEPAMVEGPAMVDAQGSTNPNLEIDEDFVNLQRPIHVSSK